MNWNVPESSAPWYFFGSLLYTAIHCSHKLSQLQPILTDSRKFDCSIKYVTFMIHKDTNEILLMHVIYVVLRYLKVASVQYSTNTMYEKIILVSRASVGWGSVLGSSNWRLLSRYKVWLIVCSDICYWRILQLFTTLGTWVRKTQSYMLFF